MMKEKDIYDYLNNVESSYEEIKLDDLKLARIKKSLNIGAKKKKSAWPKRLVGLAAALALIFVGLFASDGKVLAEIQDLVGGFFTERQVDLTETKDFPEEVKRYTVKLHETVTLDHFSFVIEDVVIDGNYGYLNLIYPREYWADYNKDYKYLYIINNIYVNGEKYQLETASSKINEIGDGLVSDYREFVVDRDLPASGNINLGIEFGEFSNSFDRALIELNISMDQVTADTKVYLEDFNIPGLENTKIEKMLINLLNPRIFLVDGDNNGLGVLSKSLVGVNDQGQKIVFKLELASSISGTKTYKNTFVFVDKGYQGSDELSDFTVEELYGLKDSFTFSYYITYIDLDLFGNYKTDSAGRPILHREKVGENFQVNFN